ncbi:MAG: Zn-dependent alcohol dehydrogenase [Actinomycetota bacterium]
MRAALLESSATPLTVVDDIVVADPRPGEVLVRVTHCGVCHSDLSVVNGTFPLTGPTVLGHEAAGVVEAVGDGVAGLASGNKVVLTPIAACDECYWCLRGEYGCCVRGSELMTGTFIDGHTPLSRSDAPVLRGLGVGGFAEYAVTSASAAVRVPDDTPLEIACVLGCAVQTGVGAVLNTARVESGASVLVAGAGGIGIAIVQGARVAGATTVIVSDPVAERRENARRFGATHVLDPNETDVPAAAHDLTGGVGVDYAFEAVGLGALVEACLWATRNGGTTIMVGAGGLDQQVTLAPAVVFMATERKVVGSYLGSCNGRRDIPRLISLWRAGRLDLEGMITARRPLSEINDAFADMTATRGIRTVLEPGK